MNRHTVRQANKQTGKEKEWTGTHTLQRHTQIGIYTSSHIALYAEIDLSQTERKKTDNAEVVLSYINM